MNLKPVSLAAIVVLMTATGCARNETPQPQSSQTPNPQEMPTPPANPPPGTPDPNDKPTPPSTAPAPQPPGPPSQ
jgi:hypothetical protein